jgi:hypothetical protein
MGRDVLPLSAAARRTQKRPRKTPTGSRSASYHEEVDYKKEGKRREGCLKVALEQLPRAENHQEDYENEEQDNRQFFQCVACGFFH